MSRYARRLQAGAAGYRPAQISSVMKMLVNAGADYGAPENATTSSFSNTNYGMLDSAYHFEDDTRPSDPTSLEFIAGRGWKLLKLPFRWERLQPTLAAALDATQAGYMTSYLNRCQTAGLQVVLSPHNFGLYYLYSASLTKGQATPIGDANLPVSDFADLWSRIVTQWDTHPAVYGYDLMCEPQNGGGLTKANWQTASQQALTAIRNAGSTKPVIVGGWNWSACQNWQTNNGASGWITDTANNFFYDAHHYWDSDTSGTYANTYAYEVTASQNAGYTAGSNADALTTRILTELQGFADWCTSNSVKGIIGEYGWPSATDSVSWNTLGDTYLSKLASLTIGWGYWACGEFEVNPYDPLAPYNASATTGNGPLNTPQPQAGILESRLS